MAEQVVAEYKLDVDQAVKGLDKLQAETKQLDKDLDKAGKDGTKALDNVGKEASTLSSGLKKLGGVIAAAFAVDRLVSFGKEAVGLAAKAEGIKRAFDRLNNPTLLADLRKATRGTVSDLELMQRAVQAKNFKIPLEQMAVLFEFATKRATETGQSVDYLVDSIITGLGRKSPLILDNLQLTTKELQEELGNTSLAAASIGELTEAAAKVAKKAIQEMGDQADTTAIKLSQLSTIWDNFIVVAGEGLINLGTGFAYLFGLLESGDPVLEGQKKAAKELAEAYGNDLKGAVDDMVKSNQELLASQLRVAELEESRTYQNSREAIDNINKQIEAEKLRQQFLREYVANLKAIYDRSKQVDQVEKEEIRNVFFLQNLIKSLKDERELEGTTRERIIDINKQLIPLEEELAFLLGKEVKAAKEVYEAMELRRIAMSETIPVVVGLLDTIDGLNKELSKQTDILNSSPEFSKRYKDAQKAIKDLKKETKEFNDDFIDPSQGFPDSAPGGNQSATGLGLLGSKSEFNKSLDQWSRYAGEVSNIIGAISQIQANAFAYEQQELERQLEQGILSREEYERKRIELARKQAQSAKDAQLFQATISMAQAIVAALGSVPFSPANIALAALVGATGAAQIAAIASTPLPQFAEGVIGLKGAGTETSDSIPAMLSKNESVMTAAETRKYKDELWAIRRGNFEDLIMTKYVKPMIDESLFKGFADIGKSAQLNGLTANLKDHNILAAIDRDRQATVYGLNLVATKLDKLSRINTRRGW